MNNKSRKVKEYEYYEKYGHIPVDYYERLAWMYDYYNINEKKENEILTKKSQMLESLFYNDLNIVLFEMPEGTPRSRFRIINRTNFMNAALENSSFVHVYSVNAKEDSRFMHRLAEQELIDLQNLITTPINVTYCTFFQTPKTFSSVDTFLAEFGIHRPLVKPDWDNLGKKYSDMSNQNIWLDDSFVIDGTTRKFYSTLPRVEIRIRYLNMVYTKYQYDQIVKRKDFIDNNCELEYFKGRV